MRTTLLLLLTGLVAAPTAAAQTGSLDQDSPFANVSFNCALPGWSRMQNAIAGVDGQLEGIVFEVASSTGADTATIRIWPGWNPPMPGQTPLFDGQVVANGSIAHERFVDMTSANILLQAGDMYSIEFVADSQSMGCWGNALSSGGYPWDFYEDNGSSGWQLVGGNTRLGFKSYMLPLPPPGPSLVLNANCPGIGSISVANATPNGTVGLAWSNMAGNYTMNGGPCPGVTIGLIQPRLLVTGTADGNGDWNFPVSIPSGACGNITIQVMDLGSCTPTNTVAL